MCINVALIPSALAHLMYQLITIALVPGITSLMLTHSAAQRPATLAKFAALAQGVSIADVHATMAITHSYLTD